MKILILSSKVPFPPRDGGAIATISLAEGLHDAGNEVLMLCLNTSKHPYDVNKIHPYLRKKIRFFAVNHDTRIRPFRVFINYIFSREPYNAIRFMSQRFDRRLKEVLLSEKPDIVQLEGPYMGYYIKSVKKYSYAGISLRAHNVEAEIWSRKAFQTINPLKKKYFRVLAARIKKLETRVLQQCDFLVAISERDRKCLLDLSEIRSITIPTGLNPHRYPSPKEPTFPSLFFIGALDWMPNQEGLLWFIEEVFVSLNKNMPELDFHIAGRNAPEWLKNKIDSFSIQAIKFHGEVENAYEFMNRYAIFISPLFTGSGIRIKILEGMMMQRAIVATRIAAEGLPVSDRKNIIITDDPMEMDNIIYELARDKQNMMI